MGHKQPRIPLKIEIDLNEFYDDFGSIYDWVCDSVKEHIKSALSKDPEIKKLIAQKKKDAISKIMGES